MAELESTSSGSCKSKDEAEAAPRSVELRNCRWKVRTFAPRPSHPISPNREVDPVQRLKDLR